MKDAALLDFEWDPGKAQTNLKKHGVSFLTAAAVFRQLLFEEIDTREAYGEVRHTCLGLADTTVYRVVYTWREENLVRIISARKASRSEENAYYREVLPQRN